MPNRREFLAMSTLAAAGMAAGLRGASAKAAPHWKPYHNTIAIDGEGGFSLFFLDNDDDPSIPKEIAAAHECGLSGVFCTVAPNGRFWMNDAAFEKTKSFIATSKAKIAAHPDTFTQILAVDDLKR